jgi:hypothetical protein
MVQEIYQIGKCDTLDDLKDQLNSVLFEMSKRFIDVVGFHDIINKDGFDFTLDDFTTNGEWQVMDISNIVPEEAKAVIFGLTITDGAAGNYFEIRSYKSDSNYNTFKATTNVVDQPIGVEGFITLSNGRRFEYRGTNTTFSAINLILRGYWIW